MTQIRLVKKSDLSSNILHKIYLQNTPVLATLDAEGVPYVFASMCPHADKTLQQATWNPVTKHLTCRFHWAVFDLSQGGKLESGPQCESLKVYETTVGSDNGVEFVFVASGDRI